MTDANEQAQHYQSLLAQYKVVSGQIHDMLAKYDGHTENMPACDMELYRKLAQERDTLYAEMKAIESNWLEDA